QIGNIRNRRDPARDLAFIIAPWLVHDVIEPWLTTRNRNFHVELDTLAAQDTLDIRADRLEGFGTHHVDHWTSNDLLSRQPHELLVCTVAREVTLITAATCESYRGRIQYLAHVFFGSNRGERRRLYLICHRREAGAAGQRPFIFYVDPPCRRMRYYPQRADRLSLGVKRHQQRFDDRRIDRHTVIEMALRIREQGAERRGRAQSRTDWP